MDDMRLKFYNPIVSGVPGAELRIPPVNRGQETAGSFQDILQGQIDRNSNVAFSKHAVKRAVDHNIMLSDERLARLNEGVRLANEKNLDDALILIDETAFIVNAKNNTVITAKNREELKGNVFTNINGTVII